MKLMGKDTQIKEEKQVNLDSNVVFVKSTFVKIIWIYYVRTVIVPGQILDFSPSSHEQDPTGTLFL